MPGPLLSVAPVSPPSRKRSDLHQVRPAAAPQVSTFSTKNARVGSQGLLTGLLHFGDDRNLRGEDDRLLLHYDWCREHRLTCTTGVQKVPRMILAEVGSTADFDAHVNRIKHCMNPRHLFRVALKRWRRQVLTVQRACRRYIGLRDRKVATHLRQWEKDESLRRACKHRQLAAMLHRKRIMRSRALEPEQPPEPPQPSYTQADRARVFGEYIALRTTPEVKYAVMRRLWSEKVKGFIVEHKDWRRNDLRQQHEPRFVFAPTLDDITRHVRMMNDERAQRRLAAARRPRMWALAWVVAALVVRRRAPQPKPPPGQPRRSSLRRPSHQMLPDEVRALRYAATMSSIPGSPRRTLVRYNTSSPQSSARGAPSPGASPRLSARLPSKSKLIDHAPSLAYGCEKEQSENQDAGLKALMRSIGSFIATSPGLRTRSGGSTTKLKMLEHLAVEQGQRHVISRQTSLADELAPGGKGRQRRASQQKQLEMQMRLMALLSEAEREAAHTALAGPPLGSPLKSPLSTDLGERVFSSYTFLPSAGAELPPALPAAGGATPAKGQRGMPRKGGQLVDAEVGGWLAAEAGGQLSVCPHDAASRALRPRPASESPLPPSRGRSPIFLTETQQEDRVPQQEDRAAAARRGKVLSPQAVARLCAPPSPLPPGDPRWPFVEGDGQLSAPPPWLEPSAALVHPKRPAQWSAWENFFSQFEDGDSGAAERSGSAQLETRPSSGGAVSERLSAPRRRRTAPTLPLSLPAPPAGALRSPWAPLAPAIRSADTAPAAGAVVASRLLPAAAAGPLTAWQDRTTGRRRVAPRPCRGRQRVAATARANMHSGRRWMAETLETRYVDWASAVVRRGEVNFPAPPRQRCARSARAQAPEGGYATYAYGCDFADGGGADVAHRMLNCLPEPPQKTAFPELSWPAPQPMPVVPKDRRALDPDLSVMLRPLPPPA